MANQIYKSNGIQNSGPDLLNIWFFEHTRKDVEELICPPVNPMRIIGKVIGRKLKSGKLAQYYFMGTMKECKVIFTCLLLADVECFEVRSGLYYVRKKEISIVTAGMISGMHFREATWDE